MQETCVWTGASGRTYLYEVFPIADAGWSDRPGNYIFARRTANGWQAIYIGEAGGEEGLRQRLVPSHDKWDRAIREGATHIHAHTTDGDKARLDEERDLMLHHRPPCNDQRPHPPEPQAGPATRILLGQTEPARKPRTAAEILLGDD